MEKETLQPIRRSPRFPPKVGLVYDPIMAGHRNEEDFHWERPERVLAIYQTLLQEGFIPQLIPVPSRAATDEDLAIAHAKAYIQSIIGNLSRPKHLIHFNDQDMYANEFTLQAARISAGSTLDLTRQVLSGQLDSGFALVRPPGHHATTGKCMGFCYFNNVGLAAIDAARSTLTTPTTNSSTSPKVLIVDWDVHFGNGTVKLIEKNQDLRNLLFISIHRWDYGKFYPGNGRPSRPQQGSREQQQQQYLPRIYNIGFNGSEGDDYYLDAFRTKIIPMARQFQPDIILVSAGFDAAQGDPLGQCQVTPEAYYQMTKMLQSVCPKMVMVLEEGYNLVSISESSLACIRALLYLPYEPPAKPLEFPYSDVFNDESINESNDEPTDKSTDK